MQKVAMHHYKYIIWIMMKKEEIFMYEFRFVYVQNLCCIIFFPHKKSFIIFNLNRTNQPHTVYKFYDFFSYLWKKKKWKEKASETGEIITKPTYISHKERKKWEKIMLRASWNIKSIFIEIYVHRISQRYQK